LGRQKSRQWPQHKYFDELFNRAKMISKTFFFKAWQWNFMADGWFEKSKLKYQAHEPVLLTVTFPFNVYINETKSYEVVSRISIFFFKPNV
jgi:hypothetical protein